MITSLIDQRSEKNIQTLVPEAQQVFRDFLIALNENFMTLEINAVVICGTRTYAEQDVLYAKGRTIKGKIVTNARGGYSYHNFGIAIDIGLFKYGKYLDDHPKLYEQIGIIVRKFPELEWGGDWKSPCDPPHVQYRTFCTMAELRERVAKKQEIV